MIVGIEIENGHVTLTTLLLGVVCHSYAGTLYSPPVFKIFTTIASAVPEIW